MIKILDNMLAKLRQKRLAMRGPWEQDWRAVHDPVPIRAFDCNVQEEMIEAKKQVKYDFKVTYGKEMYCIPNALHIDDCGRDLFECVRHELLGDVIAAVYDIRSEILAGSTPEAIEGLDQLLKDLGER